MAGSFTQIPEIAGADVRQFVLLQIGPDILDRIQFRRVGRQPVNLDSAFERVEIVPDQLAAMRGQAIPNDREFAGDGAQQVGQEDDDVFAANRFFKDLEIEIPDCQPCNQGKSLPIEVMK